MNQILTTAWSKNQLILFRFTFCYFVLFFIFWGGIFPTYLFPFLDFINIPFRYISDTFFVWLGEIFLNKNEKLYTADAPLTYVAVIALLFFSIIITLIWSTLDKRDNYNKLYAFLHTYIRFYLAYILFSYGFNKLFIHQFFPARPSDFIKPFSMLDHPAILWRYMGASSSYTFLGGLLEVTGAVLLFFRRTTTIGAILIIITLFNVLMINIGYDVYVKLPLFHYLLLAIFMMRNDIKSLYQIFILHKPSALTIVPPAIKLLRFKWIIYFIKFSLIGFMIFKNVKLEIAQTKRGFFNSSFRGIYNIDSFYKNGQLHPPLITDNERWKKIAVNGKTELAIQSMNDSLKFCRYQLDTIAKTFQFNLYTDTTSKYSFHYTYHDSTYHFSGFYKNDSIRFSMKVVDMSKFPLVRNRNKIKWTWNE